MHTYAGPERRKYIHLRKAVDDSLFKDLMIRIVRKNKPELLSGMDSEYKILNPIIDSLVAKPKKRKDKQ